MSRRINQPLLRLKYLDELNAKVDELRLNSRAELLERFYQLQIQPGFTHEEGVEYDAILVVLKAMDKQNA